MTEKWLPYVRQILGDEHKRPIILVGNKTDLTDTNTLDVSYYVFDHFSISGFERNHYCLSVNV